MLPCFSAHWYLAVICFPGLREPVFYTKPPSELIKKIAAIKASVKASASQKNGNKRKTKAPQGGAKVAKDVNDATDVTENKNEKEKIDEADTSTNAMEGVPTPDGTAQKEDAEMVDQQVEANQNADDSDDQQEADTSTTESAKVSLQVMTSLNIATEVNLQVMTSLNMATKVNLQVMTSLKWPQRSAYRS